MAQLRFTKDHEWVRLEGSEVVCGISSYAQKALGDIVYVDLPAAGKKLGKGDEAAVVESAKAASEVYAPVDGEIIAVNDNLTQKPALVNSAPTGDGWFFRMKPLNAAQLDELMDEAAYEKYVKDLT